MTTISNTDNGELAAALSHREGQAPFNKPWKLRVFAVAAAPCEAGEEWRYYEHFVTALI
ncbi:hypothetical protein ABRZ24_01705 [Brenneria populi]|uniref:Uncharacterized protein n=1 Tax=Brenneria populi TaxID=1505588 RepID=A0ABU6JKY2_9GAMM|nr:hypothetical protein [Brenneria populi Li et al. 2015]